MPTIDTGSARSALACAYQALGRDVARLGEAGLGYPSLCLGWTREDLLFHSLLDAQRALVTFATPADGEPDVDFVTYWHPFKPGAEDYEEHARFVRRCAAAYSSGLEIAGRWLATTAAVLHASQALQAGLKVATQGHVLTAGDFMATVAVEAAIHHLDLLGEPAAAHVPPGHGDDQPPEIVPAAGPGAEALAVVRRTLDGLLGEPGPAAWDDVTYALKATGRAALSADDRERLGALAGRFPLLG